MKAQPVSTTLSTLERGLRTLEYVARRPREATAKEIATALDMKLTSAYHLLRTLLSEGYLVKVSGGTYDIGQRGASLGDSLRNHFQPLPELSAILARLHMKTRETVYISGWHHGAIALQQVIAGNGPVVVAQLDVGFSADMHARASCKSMLAHVDDELISQMFEGLPLRSITPTTITTYEGLIQDLRTTRKRGYATDEEEFHSGVTCVSAAFFDPKGSPAGSYTISMASGRAREDLCSLAADVMDAADFATKVLAKRSALVPAGDTR
ncbi:MAG: IclR family transcriptional regulator [Leucobacter sp.]